MTLEIIDSTRLIGQALLEEGLLNDEQLKEALASQAKKKLRIGETAVSLGFLTDKQLAQLLSKIYHLPYLELDEDEELDIPAIELVPESLARRYRLIVTKNDNGFLTVAMSDPMDVRAADAVRLETKCRIRKAISTQSAIERAIDRSYHASSRIAKSMDRIVSGEATRDETLPIEQGADVSTDMEQLRHEASDAPVVQFVNLLLMRAIQERASDVHIEAEEHSANVRIRVDGRLREITMPAKGMLQPITTRIKLLGNLDITERRLPQDGRFKFKVFDRTIDVRLSSLPTVYGEKLVLRLLDRASIILDMKSLGFESGMLETFKHILEFPYGLVILTGPTGSGKTTTLYAALNTIKTSTKNIVTVEDPVEYQLAKINQVHTKPEIGLTFASGLRHILRQDPDIIMVGEIRDRETAEICIRSALTGHLVLSTLHTNDAVSAVSRLTDMGIEPYLLTASLSLVMAQRLVRRVCEDCAEPWDPPKELIDRVNRLERSDEGNGRKWKFLQGKGCRRCGQSGYLGRIAVYEQFVISESIKTLITERATASQLRRVAQKEGFQSLLQSALHKVRDGITTLDEAFSVCATQVEMAE